MGADARYASARSRAAARRPGLSATVLLAGVLIGLIAHLLGALNHQGAAHHEGAAPAPVAVSASVDATHAQSHHVAAPTAGSGTFAGPAADGVARLDTPLAHEHDDAACGSLLRPSGSPGLELAGCADRVEVLPRLEPAPTAIPSGARAAATVARPSDSPGRQRI